MKPWRACRNSRRAHRPALKDAGWDEAEGSRVLREHGIMLGQLQGGGRGGQSLRAKAGVADYVVIRGATPAVMEAARAPTRTWIRSPEPLPRHCPD